MAKKSLKTLCKVYEFENEYEYFDYIIESLINGNRAQCRKLFNDLREADKKAASGTFVKWVLITQTIR